MARGSRTCLDDGPAHSLVGDERGGRAAAVGGERVGAAREQREQEEEEGEEDNEEEEKGAEEEQRLQPHVCGRSALPRGTGNSGRTRGDSRNGHSGDGGAAPALGGGTAGRGGRAGAGTGNWELRLGTGSGRCDSGSWKQEIGSRRWDWDLALL